MIDTDSLKKMQDTGAALTVVDARNPEEYQEVHITGRDQYSRQEILRKEQPASCRQIG